MKKYITTDKHPAYKEGLIYEEDEDEYNLYIDKEKPFQIWETIDKKMIEGHMSEGWIEEIQEKEFTKYDMIKFAKLYAESYRNVESDFLYWVKEKNKPFEK